MLTLGLEKLSISLCMIILFVLIPLNPHLSSLFLTIDNLIKIGNLFIELLLGEFKLALNSLLFGIQGLIRPLEVHYSLIQFFDFLVFPHHGLLIKFENLVLALAFLNLLYELDLGLMADLVGQMELLYSVFKILK
jgi:hypothetical protein